MARDYQMVNLLPDEQQRLLNVQRINALVVGGSIVILVATVVAVILLTTAIGATQFALDQKKKEIVNTKTQIATIDKLDDGGSLEARATILQSQLAQLSTAYSEKAKKQFALSLQRIAQILPPTVSFTSANIDASRTVTISGSAKSYNEAARFAQALKADGKVLNIPGSQNAGDNVNLIKPTSFFTDVKLQSVAFSSNNLFTYNVTYVLGEGADSVQ